MSRDPLDYQSWIQESFRGIVRRALALVAEEGFPGDHHFSIGFRTDHPGVEVSDGLRKSYPQEMLIVLQHQFRNLVVEEDAFYVDLSFGGRWQRIRVPFESVLYFEDPAVQFRLHIQPGPQPPHPGESRAEVSEADNVVSLDSFRKK